MSIDLDLTRALRGLDGLRGLVHAIVAAHPSDESDWIEWKTDVDLGDKAGCFLVAKAILGMANRPVEVAARTCGGFGYIAVGVEPGNLVGVQVPDPADWIGRVEHYVKGDAMPVWDWTIVPVEDVSVLLITVDPPQNGDPMWPLRREFQTSRSGTLYVRKPGKTEPAVAEDVDGLQRRLLAGSSSLPELIVEVVGDLPVPWVVGAELETNVEAWVQAQRDKRFAAAQAVEDERNQPEKTLGTAARLDKLGMPGGEFLREHAKWQRMAADMSKIRVSGLPFQDEQDERTFDEYIEELNAWAEKVVDPAKAIFLHRYCSQGYGIVHLRVTNTSDQYLGDVEVHLHIDFERAKGFEEIPAGSPLPKAPWPYGKVKPTPTSRSFLSGFVNPPPIFPHVGDYARGYVRDTHIEDGSIKVSFDAGELRGHATADGDDWFIVLPVRPPDGLLHATWKATVKDRNGVISGQLTIPVQEDPVFVGDVLSASSR